MSEKDQPANSKIHAEDNSIAVGGIQVGGDVRGDIRIGHTIGYTSEQVSALIAQISSTFQAKPFDGRCPYKGLEVFEEEDADLFFGRERLVEDLVGHVKESRTVFITGPSGSGKSSLVRAGLMYALRQGAIRNSERWLYETMKPGRDPLAELARVTARLAGTTNAEDEVRAKGLTDETIFARWCEIALKDGRDKRAVIFADQFEEVFTQISKEEERVAFLNLLTYAASAENGRVAILFSMRSDFIPNCATYPKLNKLLNRKFLQIGAMQADELVNAIAQPALRVGLKIDADLIAQVINDMNGEPGALPLMQFALKDLFDAENDKGGAIALTRSGYLQRGGIHRALERHADRTFATFNADEQELARSVFSRLIEIGRGTQDTRRTALSNELIPAGTQRHEVESVVQKLASARLVTTDKVTVTISHEKLIDAWPWLKQLVNENREVIALQNEIAEHARQWESHGRDHSYLYTGARLANAREKLEANKLVLSGLARDFVDAGVQMEESKQQEDERRRQKELDDAHKLAETAQAQARAERRGRLVTIGMLVVAASLIIVLSFNPARREFLRQRAVSPKSVMIEAGNYLLGDEQAAPASNDYLLYQEYPISAFVIDVDPVTNERYQYCIQAGVCSRPNALRAEYESSETEGNPVSHVTAMDAAEFCDWLGMRLPTDKEWEVMASKNLINLPASQPGMSSFYEWTMSIYSNNLDEWTDISQDPKDWLVKKGGRLDNPLSQNMTYRQGTDPTDSDEVTGFRCAISR